MLFENNTFYITVRFLLILFGTFGMAASTARLRRNPTRNIILFFSYILYAFAFFLLFITFWGYEGFLRIVILAITVPAVIMLYFTADEPLARLVFTRVTQVLFSIYVAGSATLLNDLLHGNMLSSLLILVLFYAAAITLEFLLLRKRFMYIAETIKKGWGILSLIPCTLTVLILLVALYPKHYTESAAGICLSYLLLAVIIVIYFAIFWYLHTQYCYQMQKRNMEILQLQVQSIKKEQENVETLVKQTKIIRHDTRHMLSVIASFARKGDAQAIIDYAGRFSAEDICPDPIHYCDDTILDATLSGYFNKAKKMGFSLDISLSFPDMLPLDAAAFAICFANALDYAVSVSLSRPQEERKLVVKCIDKPKLMFEVAASLDNGPAGNKQRTARFAGRPYVQQCRPQSKLRKRSQPSLCQTTDRHDLNLNSIRAFCSRYGAVSSFHTENGWLKIIIVL